MAWAANQSTALLARVPTVPDAEAALLGARCRCHGAKRGEVDLSGARCSQTAEPSVAGRLLRPLFEHVRARVPGENQLAQACAAWLHEERIAVTRADAVLLEASRWLGDSGLGLHALANLTRGDGDALELAAESAPSVEAALEMLARHASLVCDVVELHLYVEGETAALELRYAVNISRVLRDFLLGALAHASSRWLGGLSDVEVWLAEPTRAAASAYSAVFSPAGVKLAARCDALVFPAARLMERPRTADAALHAVLLRVLRQASAAEPGVVPLSVRVRHALSERLSTADGNVESVARSLALSTRSLARKLQEEGVTFSELLESMRRERALHYVEQSSLAPQEIAYLLGYSTTSAFCRAFARWYGRSALDMRRAAADARQNSW